ncbi:MAG: DUF2520 domain-containing protein [Bacteroidaceae bacterium]|nr:DUF2520 domain-containing protein [Bacteroidaceae bacterium]
MKIVLIGRGRLATNLEHALLQAGHDVVSINSRTLESLPLEADVFVVAVKDAALTDVLRAATKGREDQLFVHTAGSMPMNLFAGLTAHYGVFYPMQTFSKERLVDFNEISVFLETNDAASMERLKMLAATLTPHVYELDSEGRKHLHLAAVFACNFVNHCYALSAEVLKAKGLPFSVMLPLVDETAQKVHELSPKDAQTGPAVRGDQNVMQMQAGMLADIPAVKQIYEALSNDIQRLADND